MTNPKNISQSNLIRDLAIIVASIVVAVVLVKTGLLAAVLADTKAWLWLGSLLAGMFFVSVFTAAPAGTALFALTAENSVWTVAFFGAIGALIGDWLIFHFIKDSLSEDIDWLIKKIPQHQKMAAVFRFRLFHWLTPFVGALIVASPLPDEIGLAMMGLSKIRTWVFAPVSFGLNFFGILVVGLLARAI